MSIPILSRAKSYAWAIFSLQTFKIHVENIYEDMLQDPEIVYTGQPLCLKLEYLEYNRYVKVKSLNQMFLDLFLL